MDYSSDLSPSRISLATEELVKEDAKKQGYDSEFVDYYIIEMSKNIFYFIHRSIYLITFTSIQLSQFTI